LYTDTFITYKYLLLSMAGQKIVYLPTGEWMKKNTLVTELASKTHKDENIIHNELDTLIRDRNVAMLYSNNNQYINFREMSKKYFDVDFN